MSPLVHSPLEEKTMFPIADMFTGDEVQEALARALLARKGVSAKDTETILRTADARVTYRNVKMPDGQTYMFAFVVVVKREKSTTDTPVPEVSDG
jgi:hypothetical protein